MELPIDKEVVEQCLSNFEFEEALLTLSKIPDFGYSIMATRIITRNPFELRSYAEYLGETSEIPTFYPGKFPDILPLIGGISKDRRRIVIEVNGNPIKFYHLVKATNDFLIDSHIEVLVDEKNWFDDRDVKTIIKVNEVGRIQKIKNSTICSFPSFSLDLPVVSVEDFVEGRCDSTSFALKGFFEYVVRYHLTREEIFHLNRRIVEQLRKVRGPIVFIERGPIMSFVHEHCYAVPLYNLDRLIYQKFPMRFTEFSNDPMKIQEIVPVSHEDYQMLIDERNEFCQIVFVHSDDPPYHLLDRTLYHVFHLKQDKEIIDPIIFDTIGEYMRAADRGDFRSVADACLRISILSPPIITKYRGEIVEMMGKIAHDLSIHPGEGDESKP